jgi:bifunctional DNase/RNase
MLIRRFFARLLARSSSGARASWPKLVVALLILLALPAVAYWRGLGTEASDVGANATEMTVEYFDPTPSKFNLVLKEKAGPRRLVVAIGVAEAASIIQDLNLPYNAPPVTAYAMTRTITDRLGGKIQRVVVDNVTDKAFAAKIVLMTDNHEVAIDAAPSDAIALALRAKAPIFADPGVLDKAGIITGR